MYSEIKSIKKKTSSFATLQTGLFAKPETSGEIVYLQVKHFNENGTLQSAIHPDLSYNNITQKHLLQPGDIVFAAKGAKNFAAIFEDHNPPAVASTSFFVIRLHSKEVLPAYLCWYLNLPQVINQLKDQAIGTSLPSISKSVIDQLEVPVPTLQQQQIILNIAQLQFKEKQLRQRIMQLKDELIQQQIFNVLK